MNAPDTWQTGTRLNVTVRLTLVQKGIEIYDYRPGITEYVTALIQPPGSLELRVHGGPNRTYGYDYWEWCELEYYEPVNLTEDGDYWEKQIHVEMSDWAADSLHRGETANATLSVRFYLAEYDSNHTQIFTPNIGGPITGIAVFKPLLSAAETYAVGGTVSAMALGLLVLGLHRVGRLPLCRWGHHEWRDCGDRVVVRWGEPRALEDPSHPHPLDKVKKEDTVMSGRKCQYCGLHQKRKFTKNKDGEWEVVGWEDAESATDPR